jgi:hypothetical protein
MTKRSPVPAAIALMLFASAASAQTINQRLENQHDRIQAGIQDDQLTKGEATRLKADDAAIHAEERVDRKANDGRLSKSEKKQLNRQLNRNSRRIYRDRHNNRTPKS